MRTIIILLIANFIILKLFGINILKHLLFNPKINASITILTIILYFIEFARVVLLTAIDSSLNRTAMLLIGLIIVWGISILDCIQDIRRGEDYYGRVEDRISPLYAVKSITSWLTGGLSRVLFYLVTSLYVPRAALSDVKATFKGKTLEEVDPQFPYGSSFVANFFTGFYTKEFLRYSEPYITAAVSYVVENLFMEWRAVRYEAVNPSYGCPYTDDRFVVRYGEKYNLLKPEIENRIKRNLATGKFLTNKDYVDEEFKLRESRLAKVSEKEEDKNFFIKITEKATEEGRQALTEAQEEREKARSELLSKTSLYTYVDRNFYEDCKRKVLDALSDRACMPVRAIAELEGMSFLRELQQKDFKLDRRWREYFVIFIMQSLVQEGIVKDEAVLDGILDTHQYGLVNGRTMLIRDVNNTPELDLDDDD